MNTQKRRGINTQIHKNEYTNTAELAHKYRINTSTQRNQYTNMEELISIHNMEELIHKHSGISIQTQKN